MPVKCLSCGKLTSEKNALCTYCSKPLLPPAICKSCDKEVPANRPQCMYCGSPVEKPAAAIAPAEAEPAQAPAPQPKPLITSTKPLESFEVPVMAGDKEGFPIGTLVMCGAAGFVVVFVVMVFKYVTAFYVIGALALISTIVGLHSGESDKKVLPFSILAMLLGCGLGGWLAIAAFDRPVNRPRQDTFPTTVNTTRQPVSVGVTIKEANSCIVTGCAELYSNTYRVNYTESCAFCKTAGQERESRVTLITDFRQEVQPIRGGEFTCAQCQRKNRPSLCIIIDKRY